MMLPRIFRRRRHGLSPAHGRALDLIARDVANIGRRGILERLPWIGDRLFRRRIEMTLRGWRRLN